MLKQANEIFKEEEQKSEDDVKIEKIAEENRYGDDMENESAAESEESESS